MLDFHMERAHDKKQAGALEIDRKAIMTRMGTSDSPELETTPKLSRRSVTSRPEVTKYEPIETKRFDCPDLA